MSIVQFENDMKINSKSHWRKLDYSILYRNRILK